MFIHPRSSLENHTRFQTKMGKVYNPFSDQNSAKTLPDGAAHTYIAYTREYPPGIFCWRGPSKCIIDYIFIQLPVIFFTIPDR